MQRKTFEEFINEILLRDADSYMIFNEDHWVRIICPYDSMANSCIAILENNHLGDNIEKVSGCVFLVHKFE